ncbi:MAG: hypothetical protein WB680_14870 [Candidatus Acidiferrales bacterium]
MTTQPKPIVTKPAAVRQPAGLSAQTPLLLLPVNIQTRFMNQQKGSAELWVRIYPDQIAVDSHEPELTDQEMSDGKSYWNAVWQAGNPPPNPDDAKAAWRMVASLYEAQRAAWICSQLTPTNLAQQPVAPTPSGTPPLPEPIFPAVTIRNSSWEKPAVADALPDAWTVILVSSGQSMLYRSTPVVLPLAVSLTPNSGAFPAGAVVDADLQWMVDFQTAVQAGMALKIPLTAELSSKGIDQIFVYGLRGSDAQANQTFAELLNAHHYTDGLALVAQGAPTNNTPDASSAYSRKDPNYEISFETEREGPLTSDANCDGVTLASFVGIPATTFDHVAHADDTDSLDSTDMLRALWPATLGYFLNQMMASVFSADVIEHARQWVLSNAYPRGPIPALRVGRTPYGILPVTSLRNYGVDPKLAGPVETGLVNFVQKLWPTWLASSGGAPRMQRGGDPDQNLMSVLGMDASSMNFQGRQVMGSVFLWNLLSFLGAPQAFQLTWWQNYQASGRALLNNYGYSQWNPRILTLGFSQNSFPIGFSTVQDGPLSESETLNADANLGGGQKGNYISWLQTAAVADIQAENYPGTKPTSLLYKILRQSLLLEYANLAGLDEVRAGKLGVAQIQESELISVQPAATTLTPWQVLARPATPNPHISWAEYLLTPNFPAESPFAQLNDLRASLGRLAKLHTAELDRLLTETLDACSHRLDVWATAIATSLLKRARARQNSSVWLGCYGWVEDVRPESGRAAVEGSELQQVRVLDSARSQNTRAPVQLPIPLQPLTDNGGYILAPSSVQAAVAAVLRNGYMTHRNTAEEGLLSIDLSSERVQKAVWLIEGVQEGQSLNALLGYLFEDALHDQNLDTYVQAFRDAYPLVGSKLTPSSAPSEAVAGSEIVDGLALRTAWDAGKFVAGQNWGTGLPTAGTDQNAVIAILKTVDDYADALGDVSISEAVFQIIRGNFGNGGGLMDAISRGSRPPDPDVVTTPRGGIDLTNRVALLFSGVPAQNASWSGVSQHPRAAAEPWLNAWLGQMLPDPAMVRCQVQYQNGGASQTATVSLRDLNVGPLDLLAMADSGEVPQQAELEGRILYAAAVPASAQNVQIVFQTGALPPGSLAFPDVLYVAQKLRTLLGASRALAPQDMTTPETDVVAAGGAVNIGDLQSRSTAAVQKLYNDINSLTTAAAGLPAAPDPVRAALMQCSFYGVAGAIPNTTSGPDPNLANQAASALGILQARYKKASAVNVATAQVADLQGIFQNIFGNDFVVLPQFTPPDLSTLQSAFGQSASLVASDLQAPSRWFRQLTHVRPGISRLDMALSAAQALNSAAIYPPSLLLGQVPAPATLPDRWLGLPLDPANTPQQGRVAFACVTQGNPVAQNAYAGVMVDEWPERIPSTQQSASVAFHFEEPSARAPQALLLAVCPDNRETWDDQILQAVLAETLELAKIRTVDLASVQQVGQILPALYFALNLQGATASTQFALLKEEPIRAARSAS